MTARPAALWRCTDLSRFATAADGIYYVCHASENSPWWMKHFTVCSIQFPECRRLTIFSCVMTILPSWKACVVMIETTLPQDLCTVSVENFFHPITPSVSSMWFLLSSTYMLYFLVFLFFCDYFTNWEYYCGSAIIFCGPQTPPVPFNLSLPVHEPWCIYQNNIWFWRLWSMGFKLLEKHNFISFSNALIFIYKWCRTRESL